MKIALILTICNRPQYLRRCLQSLLDSQTLHNVHVYAINDYSDNEDTNRIFDHSLKSYLSEFTGIKFIRTEKRIGIRESLRRAIEIALKEIPDLIINLDSDTVVKPDFIDRLVDIKKQFPDNIVGGFNCETPKNPIVKVGDDYVAKRLINGINMAFTPDEYHKYIKPTLTEHGNWDYNTSLNCQKDKKLFYITKPSVVQHIGMVSSLGHHIESEPDFAQDFKMIELPDVCLFGIDAADPKGLLRAAAISKRDIQFGNELMITERQFPGGTRDEGRMNYSKFMIANLFLHIAPIKATHFLTIHPDGYVVNYEAWDDNWLEYDYIGAVWDWHNEYQVGNGGFSLRSKKLIKALCDMTQQGLIKEFHPEDHQICKVLRGYLERTYGIVFAPVEVAKKFSIEGWGLKPEYQVYGGEFGFHNYNLNFEGSDVPEFLWPVRPIVEGQPPPKYEDRTKFPFFLPERFRPKEIKD